MQGCESTHVCVCWLYMANSTANYLQGNREVNDVCELTDATLLHVHLSVEKKRMNQVTETLTALWDVENLKWKGAVSPLVMLYFPQQVCVVLY